jgi:hypothetical protein
MILRGATSYEGHWKGWALKIETFFGPKKVEYINSYFQRLFRHKISKLHLNDKH